MRDKTSTLLLILAVLQIESVASDDGVECVIEKYQSWNYVEWSKNFAEIGKVLNMTLENDDTPEGLCTKTADAFEHDDRLVTVRAGCRGTFRVCYDTQESVAKQMENMVKKFRDQQETIDRQDSRLAAVEETLHRIEGMVQAPTTPAPVVIGNISPLMTINGQADEVSVYSGSGVSFRCEIDAAINERLGSPDKRFVFTHSSGETYQQTTANFYEVDVPEVAALLGGEWSCKVDFGGDETLVSFVNLTIIFPAPTTSAPTTPAPACDDDCISAIKPVLTFSGQDEGDDYVYIDYGDHHTVKCEIDETTNQILGKPSKKFVFSLGGDEKVHEHHSKKNFYEFGQVWVTEGDYSNMGQWACKVIIGGVTTQTSSRVNLEG